MNSYSTQRDKEGTSRIPVLLLGSFSAESNEMFSGVKSTFHNSFNLMATSCTTRSEGSCHRR